MTGHPSIASVQATVIRLCGTSRAVMLGYSRYRRDSVPRQLAMAVAADITGKSNTVIARAFRRDHTTVLYAKRVMADRQPVAQAFLAGVVTRSHSARLGAPKQEKNS